MLFIKLWSNVISNLTAKLCKSVAWSKSFILNRSHKFHESPKKWDTHFFGLWLRLSIPNKIFAFFDFILFINCSLAYRMLTLSVIFAKVNQIYIIWIKLQYLLFKFSPNSSEYINMKLVSLGWFWNRLWQQILVFEVSVSY